MRAGNSVLFRVSLIGAQNFPNELAAATLSLTLTVQSNTGNAQDMANQAGVVYLTFGQPEGDVYRSPLGLYICDGSQPQDVTPARLALAIHAVRQGRNAINVNAGAGVPTTTGGVPNFAFGSAENCADAIFLFLKSRGVSFSLGYRWGPGVNNTGLAPQPPLHTYLWMSLSPTPGVVPPVGRPRTEAWAECHLLAVAFSLMGGILGLTPFIINLNVNNVGVIPLCYATDYPQSRRQDIAPYNQQPAPIHGRLFNPYTRQVNGPFGQQGRQKLCFIDQNGGVNNFEGVAVFNGARLYPIGECILEENNRADNVKNYYCNYPNNPDYVGNANVNPNQGKWDLIFVGDWVDYFFLGILWNWQTGIDPNPYPGAVVTNPVGSGRFRWQD